MIIDNALENPTYEEGWWAHAQGWPLFKENTTPYRLGWHARERFIRFGPKKEQEMTYDERKARHRQVEEEILAMLPERERELMLHKLTQLRELNPLAEVRSWEPVSGQSKTTEQ